MQQEQKPEPWLRGTLSEVDAVRRQVLHALELASEDVDRWCRDLSEADMHARLFDIASIAYHLRHIVRSLDRLLTYAEGDQLSNAQLASLKGEMAEPATRSELLNEFSKGLVSSRRRILAISPESYEQARFVGRKMLPSTVGGLLVHCAEHTQRHAGQLVTTSQMIAGLRRQRLQQ